MAEDIRRGTQPAKQEAPEGDVNVREGSPRKEDLLAEQELSVERQREGRGWQRLEPGQSSGTTPVQSTPLAEMPRNEEGRVTPGAARAEHEGTPKKQERRP